MKMPWHFWLCQAACVVLATLMFGGPDKYALTLGCSLVGCGLGIALAEYMRRRKLI